MSTALRSLLIGLSLAACVKPSLEVEDTDPTGGDADSGVEGDTDTDTDADTDSDTDTDTDSDTDVPCEAEIDYLNPGNGTVGVSVTPTLLAWFTAEVGEDQYTFLLEGPEGEVPGSTTLSADGLSASFTPSGELDREEEYTATVTVCEDEEDSTFTTVGDPVSGLEGNTYDVDLNSVTWNSPASGSLLAGLLDTNHILLMVEAVSSGGATIEFVGAAGWEDPSLEQYPCSQAIDFDPADFTGNPYFQLGPADTTFGAAGYSVDVSDLMVAGSFSEDASELQNLQVTGYMDVRDLEISGTDACTLVSFVGDKCISCPSDGVAGCLYLDVETRSAVLAAGVSVDPAIDPTTNPDCN